MDQCDLDTGCITCGDVAVPLTVMMVDGNEARCRADDGRHEVVALDLVGTLDPGDRVLSHAGVAIVHLKED